MQNWNVLLALVLGLVSLEFTSAIPVKVTAPDKALNIRNPNDNFGLGYRGLTKSVSPRDPQAAAPGTNGVPTQDPIGDDPASDDPSADPEDTTSSVSSAAGQPPSSIPGQVPSTTPPGAVPTPPTNTGATPDSAATTPPGTSGAGPAADPDLGNGPSGSGTVPDTAPTGTGPETSPSNEDDPDSAPTTDQPGTSTPSSGNTNFPAPYFVVYNDLGPDPAPDPAKIKGFNVVNLAFWMSTTGPVDMATTWQSMDAGARQSIQQKYKQAGIKIMVSAFGATDLPTQKDPEQIAKQLADFVTKNKLDGVDIDYEDFDAVAANKAGDWLIKLTQALRQHLPKGALLSHAPVAPWFGKGKLYAQVDKAVGKMIDWYNIQFYNQGQGVYADCNGLFNSAQDGTSVFQIHQSLGIPLEKLVVGKPAVEKDSTNGGYMEPSALGKCVADAAKKDWKGGVMSWQYPNADSKWIQAAAGTALGGSKGKGSSTGSTDTDTGDDTDPDLSATPGNPDDVDSTPDPAGTSSANTPGTASLDNGAPATVPAAPGATDTPSTPGSSAIVNDPQSSGAPPTRRRFPRRESRPLF
ncbi:glycoside hydrolase [Dendrothele bispora CBS 962.96]|uniref:Glycoside hydrolase n=1 Tax=Dendrothele bispora (strain CBS 962.96) TaxID=1314807 RepID=A0A4V4HD76_DENBC|nr:glycoside hydrolase [Dendrothele bispora CBS 962.96]